MKAYGIGRLTRDPETKVTGTGKTVTKFSVACNRRFNRDQADFFNVECWGKLAEIVSKFTAKGSQVMVEGELHKDKYEDRYYITIVADSVEFVGGKAKQETSHGMINDDDIPFGG